MPCLNNNVQSQFKFKWRSIAQRLSVFHKNLHQSPLRLTRLKEVKHYSLFYQTRFLNQIDIPFIILISLIDRVIRHLELGFNWAFLFTERQWPSTQLVTPILWGSLINTLDPDSSTMTSWLHCQCLEQHARVTSGTVRPADYPRSSATKTASR